MRAHVIENGKVANTIVVDSLDILPNLIDADLHGGSIGDSWDGQTITPKAPEPIPIPESVSMRQARLALLASGLLDTVTTVVAASGQAAQIEWEYASEVRRDSPLIAALTPALGMTEAQIDALFLAAAAL